MRLEAFLLREWQRSSAWQLLLRPLSWVYRGITAVRRTAFRHGTLARFAVSVPVVVVGNLSVGGTGKTPLVLALANTMLKRGVQPGIITRGYRRSVVGDSHLFPEPLVIHVVPEARASTAELVGDEARLLAERTAAPVYAGRNRVDAAQTLLAAHAATEVIVSDDGLQHYALRRDVEIAVVDGARGFGNGHLLPAGPLREGLSRLTEVDCIVLNNTSIGGGFQAKMPENARVMASFPISRVLLERFGKPVFEMVYGNERFQSLTDVPVFSAAEFVRQCAQKRVVAVAGIGHPPRFFDQLKGLGIPLAEAISFPDHHPYTSAEIAAIQADIILMTEKDAVKCRHMQDARLWMMQVDALLPDAFYDFVLQRLAQLHHVPRSQAA
jgi:tetraacyldisaccharide 4'-kinase